jgi:hypothetical protein
MALWRATDGSDEGFRIFDEWSQKSTKYSATETERRWDGITRSPPRDIGVGTIFHLAREDDPSWEDNWIEKIGRELNAISRAEAQDVSFTDIPIKLNPPPSAPAKTVAAPTVIVRPKKTSTPIAATPFEWVDPKTIPRRQWLYRPFYIRSYLSVLGAPSGTAKSSLVIAEALAMVTGKPLLGIKPPEPLRVWYWNGEDPADELTRRFAAAAKHYSISEDEIGSRLFVDSGRVHEIVVVEEKAVGRANYIVEPIIKEVITAIRDNKIDVMIVDPFVASHRVNENNNQAIESVAKSFSRIADEARCGVMIVHHSRKTGGENATTDDLRGASALAAAARDVRTLNVMTPKEAENAKVDERERRLHFRLDRGKSNLTRPPENADWFKLVSVDLENPGRADWDQSDHVGVVTPWTYPKIEPRQLTVVDHHRIVEAVRAGGSYRADQRAKNEPWVGNAVAAVLGITLDKQSTKQVTQIVAGLLAAGVLKTEIRRNPHRRESAKYVVPGRAAARVPLTGALSIRFEG